MSRRPAHPPAAQPPVLSPDQTRRRIERLQSCIEELQAFDPQQVQKRYNITEVVALETSITDALGAAFCIARGCETEQRRALDRFAVDAAETSARRGESTAAALAK